MEEKSIIHSYLCTNCEGVIEWTEASGRRGKLRLRRRKLLGRPLAGMAIPAMETRSLRRREHTLITIQNPASKLAETEEGKDAFAVRRL